MPSFSLLEMTVDAAKAGPLGCDFIPASTAPLQAGTKRKSLLAFVSGVRVPKDSLSQLTDHLTPFTRGQEGGLAATLGLALYPLSSGWFNAHENPSITDKSQCVPIHRLKHPNHSLLLD